MGCLRYGLAASAGLECAVCRVRIEREVFRPPQDPLSPRVGLRARLENKVLIPTIILGLPIQTKILGSKPIWNPISSDGQVGKARH